jgi:hypothetical protein
MTHPDNRAAVPASSPMAGQEDPTIDRDRHRSRRRPANPRPSGPGSQRCAPARWPSAASIVAAEVARRLPRPRLPSSTCRTRRRRFGRCAVSSARAPSMALPKGTKEGHAASQARHWRQKLIISSKVSSTGATPSAMADIAVSLPRGDAPSSPVSRYVGHTGRHRPHCTHEASSESVGASGVTQPAVRRVKLTGHPAIGPGCTPAADRMPP